MNYLPIISALFLITGTSVGAGMLALPLVTAGAGLKLSLFIFILTWLVMLFSALFLLEVNLNMKPGTHLFSMAKQHLGPLGKWTALIIYLLLLYALNTAYLSGMSAFVQHSSQTLLHIHVYQWFAMLLLITVFALILFLGRQPIAHMNRYLVSIMLAGFIVLMIIIAPAVHHPATSPINWHLGWHILPVTMTAFGYQIIIPSLRHYLGGDAKLLRRIVIYGSIIPLLMYITWLLVVFGLIPIQGAHGLLALKAQQQPALALMHTLTLNAHAPLVPSIGTLFTFLAMLTSFIGVSISLFDFLRDSLQRYNQKINNRFGLIILTFAPPLLFNLTAQKAFLLALSYAGVFVAILLGILPCAMFLTQPCPKKSLAPQSRLYQYRYLCASLVLLVCIGVISAQIINPS
jgi:tyrosine-specific transport protein